MSCQKEIIDAAGTTTGGNSGGGSTTSNTYLPLTANTFWKYKDSTSSALQTNSVTSKTKTISGRLYTGVVSDFTPDTAWMAKDGSDYYIYQAVPSAGGSILFHFLNDNGAVGYTWTTNGGIVNGISALIKGKILEKGISITVNGKTYTNVIRSSMKLSYDMAGTMVDAAEYNFYTAKGIGIVQIRSRLTFFGANIPALSSLVDYQVR